MNRREFVSSAAIIAVGATLAGAASEDVMKTSGFPEHLHLVNTVARYRFEMVLKENAPAVLKESARAGGQYPRVFQHMVICDHRSEAVALTGILVEGSPDVRISVSVDGETILKDAAPAKASAAEFPDGFQVNSFPGDLFLAETPERAQAGLFLPNGTYVCVFAWAPDSIRVVVTLRTALYRVKDPVRRAPKVCETHESKQR